MPNARAGDLHARLLLFDNKLFESVMRVFARCDVGWEGYIYSLCGLSLAACSVYGSLVRYAPPCGLGAVMCCTRGGERL